MSSLQETAKPRGWGDKEKEAWLARQTIQRSYKEDVVDRLKAIPPDRFVVEQYGTLASDPNRYPLYAALSKATDENNPTILITGGVHGYEPSGIMGALRFLEEVAPQYPKNQINFAVYPCISPWAYEVDHRWNQKAEDPNRHFLPGTRVEESLKFMRSVESLHLHFRAAADLHETNKRDIELRKERHARDGTTPSPDDAHMVDGFYLCVAKGEDVALGQQVVNAVREVTQICTDKKIIGYPSDKGVIVIDNILGLCQGFARKISDFAMTTEIYPDKISSREAEDAQLVAVKKVIASVLSPTYG